MNIAGHKVPTWGVWVAIGGGGLLVYSMVKGGSLLGGSSSSSGSSSSIDPTTGLPSSMDNQVDPATGMTYLSEAQQYGSVSAAEASVSASGYQSVGGGGYYGDVGYPTISPTTTGTTTLATNAAWAQQVESVMSGLGYNPQTVAAATGRYLANLPLSNSDASLIRAAVAEVGPPPVGSFAIVPRASTSTTPASTTTASHGAHNPVSGLRATSVRFTQVDLAWDAAPGAANYLIHVREHGKPVEQFTVHGTHATVMHLKKHTSYELSVWAQPAATGHATGAHVNVTTK